MKRKKMKKKGFTLVELLVVIAIIAMLLAILMPALGKVRQLAQRIMCGTNLGGLGKAMLTYATDDKYESYPISGKATTIWAKGDGTAEGVDSWNWNNPNVYSLSPPDAFLSSTLASNLYLLVKFADVSPDQFICPGSDLKKFELSKYTITTFPGVKGFTDVWDFGSSNDDIPDKSRGKGHNSYAYQLPLRLVAAGPSPYPIATTSNPARAIAADRNPFWQDITTAKTYGWTAGTPGKVTPDTIPLGNATYHQTDGQNVLFADQHVKFEKIANCGVEMDNIYTVWGTATLTADDAGEKIKQCGKTPGTGSTGGYTGLQIRGDAAYYPLNESDSYLVCDIDNAE